MSETEEQVIVVIIAGILILLFLGILFLVIVLSYANKRKQMQNEKKALLEEFDKQILQARLEMQEQTFNFISEEIHDNVGQVLSLSKVQLSILDESNQFNRELISDIKENTSKALEELRDIAKSLSTDRIQTFDIIQCVDEEIYRINKSGLVKITLDKEGTTTGIQEAYKLILFRIIQESLQNIVKHAKASEVKIKFRGNEQSCQIHIEDNGKGFNLEEVVKNNNGLGLKNMQKRIALIGGALDLKSHSGIGTSILITINYG